jgi:hypothetical protein
VWKAKTCVVSKRGMAVGDARKTTEATLAELRSVTQALSA